MAAPQKQPRTQARNINLELAPNLNVHPDLILGNGNGIFCIGAQGTGKSVILKLIMEQSAQKGSRYDL